jgi:biopolymer transport protein ExbB
MTRFLKSLAALLCLVSLLPAQDAVREKVLSDLQAAQKRLTEQRAAQGEERRGLSSEITKLQQELLTKRRQADLSRRTVADQNAFLNNLRDKEYASTAAAETYREGLRAYGVQLNTRLFPGEAEDERFEPIYQKDDDLVRSLSERLAILELGLERIEDALGGNSYEGEATTADSRIIEGTILSFGPSLWFQSKDQSTAGSYHLARSGQTAEVDPDQAEVAKALFAGSETEALIDITGGKARALAEIKSDPLELIKKGGAWVFPILLLAVIALVFAIIKFLQLRRIRDPKDETIAGFARQYLSGDHAGSEASIASLRHPVANILPQTMQVLGSGAFELAEEVLYERLIPVRETLRSWLPFIAVTAAVAPLLGLLGTVSGLIKTFSVIAVEGTGEAQSISGGISEALITTLFGLSVAIPAFMAHALLSRRAKGIEQKSERLALVFLNEVRKSQQPSSPSLT